MKAITDTQITYLILMPGTLSSPKHVYLILIPGTPFSSPKHKSYTIQSLCYPHSKKGFSKTWTHNLLHSNSCLKQLSYWNRQGRNNFFNAMSMHGTTSTSMGHGPRECEKRRPRECVGQCPRECMGRRPWECMGRRHQVRERERISASMHKMTSAGD